MCFVIWRNMWLLVPFRSHFLANSVCWPKLCAQIRLCEQKPFRPRITVGRNKMQHYSCGRWLWFWFAAHFACCPLALRIRPVLLFYACVCACVYVWVQCWQIPLDLGGGFSFFSFHFAGGGGYKILGLLFITTSEINLALCARVWSCSLSLSFSWSLLSSHTAIQTRANTH